jgi:hypothetical protein
LIKHNPEQVLRNPSLLTPFHLLSYANLKKYTFDHHFSFPSLPSKWRLTTTSDADGILVKAVEEYIALQPPEQRGFFCVSGSEETGWKVGTLENLLNKDFKDPSSTVSRLPSPS